MERLIFHIDVNSAFLSWEAAKRVMNGEDDLRLVPSAIGGDRESRRGVILAKSIPAKKYGVKTGEPIAMALRKCPSLVLANPDFTLYERNSRAFMNVCRKYAPIVEKYSIDECFLDMSGTSKLYPDPIAIAYTIKNEIRDTLGFTVNVGIGSNKLLAKMASDFEKPDKVHTLFQDEIREKMWHLPVRELFSIGASTAQRLERAYIRTIGELAQMELSVIQSLVGIKMGEQIYRFANGEDDTSVLAEPEEAKGYSNSTTLAKDVTTVEEAHRILLALADSVTSRLRADSVKAYCVSVAIRGNDFRDRSHQKKLTEPTDITAEVFEISKRLFAEMWDRKTPLRLLGLAMTDLSKDEESQISMFPNEDRERARRVDRVLDAIRTRFGYDTIKRGSTCDAASEIGKKYKAHLDNQKKEAELCDCRKEHMT